LNYKLIEHILKSTKYPIYNLLVTVFVSAECTFICPHNCKPDGYFGFFIICATFLRSNDFYFNFRL